MATRAAILCSLVIFFLTPGCGRHPSSPLEKEKQRWTRDGWQYVETVGKTADDARYLAHVSSPSARAVTAFATAGGETTHRVYSQTGSLYLVVTLQRPSGETFALVFERAKPLSSPPPGR